MNKLLKENPLPFIDDHDVNKIFFILFGQQFCNAEENREIIAMHMPESNELDNYFRLNSMIMNSNDFSHIFNKDYCGLGTSMNPPLKIAQFPSMDDDNYDYGNTPTIK